jgi:hypothetical protein
MTVLTCDESTILRASNVGAFFSFLHSSPTILVENSTELKATDGTITIDFKGSGFGFIGATPVSGTITSIQVSLGGSTVYKFAGMSVSVPALVADVAAGNYGAALSLLLPGHDTINGSNGGDYLIDHNGHDRIITGPNDTITGSGGSDTFVFHAGFGSVLLKGFVAGSGANHDTLEFHSLPGLHTFTAVKLHESINGSGELVISDTMGDTITFANLHAKTALILADFHFMT